MTCELKIKGKCGGERILNEKVIAHILIDNIELEIDLYVADDEIVGDDVLLGQNFFSNSGITVNLYDKEFIICQNAANAKNIKKLINTNDIVCDVDVKGIKQPIKEIVNENRDVFSTKMCELGLTDALETKIEPTVDEPISQKPSLSNDQQQKAFEELKSLLSSEPV